MRSLAALALLLAGCSSAARDQNLTPIGVGSNLIDGARITAGVDSLAVLSGSGESLPNPQVLVLRTTVDSASVLRTERLVGRPTALDSFVVARATLEPRFASPRDEDDKLSTVTFERGRVIRDADGRRQIHPLERPTFYANSMDMLLRALPLRAGLAGALEIYEPDRQRTLKVTVRVRDLEQVITADDGSCSAWRVEVSGPGEYNGIFWIGARSRALVRWQADGDVIFLRLRGCAGAG